MGVTSAPQSCHMALSHRGNKRFAAQPRSHKRVAALAWDLLYFLWDLLHDVRNLP